MPNLTRDEVRTVYQKLRAKPLEEAKAEIHLDEALSRNGQWTGMSATEKAQYRLGSSVLFRAAHSSPEDVFVDSVLAGELPPLKLTAKEQELLKGAKWNQGDISWPDFIKGLL